MAIYYLHAQAIGRGTGKSAVAAAAYRSTSRIVDRETGAICDYTRKSQALFCGIVAPEFAPEWAKNRDELWNKVQEKENRKNSHFAWEYVVAIPHERKEFSRQIIQEFCEKNFASKGLVCDYAIHKPDEKGDQRNIHAHIMVTTRAVTAEGWGNKHRCGENKMSERAAWLKDVRESWADVCNKSLKQIYENEMFEREQRRVNFKKENGFFPPTEPLPTPETIDHRTLKAQGIDREPQQHQGVIATAMERKGKTPDRKRFAEKIQKTENSPDDILEKIEIEERVLTAGLKLLSEDEKERKEVEEKVEKFLKNQNAKSFALATKDNLEIIKNENMRERNFQNIERKNLSEKKPHPVGEKGKNPIKNFLTLWHDSAGKAYDKFEQYAKAQTVIISNWVKKSNELKARETESETEREKIETAKRENNLKLFFSIGQEQEKKRPPIFAKIQQNAKELLEKISEFSEYRKLKKIQDEISAAREIEKQKIEKQKKQEIKKSLKPPTRGRGF